MALEGVWWMARQSGKKKADAVFINIIIAELSSTRNAITAAYP